MNNRYIIRRETGSDYEVVDVQTNQARARGLTLDEAEAAVENLNEQARAERRSYE